jgi:hypothetical protein
MMQNTTTSNGLASWAAYADDGAQSRNLAAIALAEAMQRARTHHSGEKQIVAEPAPVLVSPKQSLDILRKKLKPLYDAIPQDVEGIDLGIVREEKPQLYLDMVAFVDIAEDGKSYRLVQGGRNGSQVLLETSDDASLIARITDYIAQRLIVRERILEQGDPVVAGAAHFTRGVSAGLAQSEAVSETYLVPPKMLRVETTDSDAFKKPAVQTPVEQKPLEPAARIEPVQEAYPVAKEAVAATIGEPRKTVDSGVRAAQPYAKNWPQTTSTRSESFASKFGEKTTGLNGWWLWPTLAVLLGMGLAAYLLYLYSMSFAA